MPHRLIVLLLLFAFLRVSAQNVSAQPAQTGALPANPTVAQIIQKYLSFVGGVQQLKDIHSRIDSGTYNYGGIDQVVLTVTVKKCDLNESLPDDIFL